MAFMKHMYQSFVSSPTTWRWFQLAKTGRTKSRIVVSNPTCNMDVQTHFSTALNFIFHRYNPSPPTQFRGSSIGWPLKDPDKWFPRQWLFQVEGFWVVTPDSVVVGYRRFGGPCCLHLQGETLVSYHDTTRRHNSKYLDLKHLPLPHSEFRKNKKGWRILNANFLSVTSARSQLVWQFHMNV